MHVWRPFSGSSPTGHEKKTILGKHFVDFSWGCGATPGPTGRGFFEYFKGVVVHEIGHSVGFKHEVCRSVRVITRHSLMARPRRIHSTHGPTVTTSSQSTGATSRAAAPRPPWQSARATRRSWTPTASGAAARSCAVQCVFATSLLVVAEGARSMFTL